MPGLAALPPPHMSGGHTPRPLARFTGLELLQARRHARSTEFFGRLGIFFSLYVPAATAPLSPASSLPVPYPEGQASASCDNSSVTIHVLHGRKRSPAYAHMLACDEEQHVGRSGVWSADWRLHPQLWASRVGTATRRTVCRLRGWCRLCRCCFTQTTVRRQDARTCTSKRDELWTQVGTTITCSPVEIVSIKPNSDVKTMMRM